MCSRYFWVVAEIKRFSILVFNACGGVWECLEFVIADQFNMKIQYFSRKLITFGSPVYLVVA